MVHSGLALNARYGMAGFVGAVKRRARQVACAIAKESEKADDFWQRPGFSNPILGGFRDPLSEYIAPLVPVFCDIPSGDEEPITFPDEPDFTGGQCDTLYSARVQVTTDNPNAAPVDRVQQFQGPLFGLVIDEIPGGSDVYVEHGLDSDGERGRTTIISGGFQVESSSFTNLGRVDGLPDDCGSPPGGGGTPDDVEVCYDAPDGAEVCVRVPVGGGPPTVRPDGSLNVPVTFDFPDGPITVDLPIGGGDPVIKPGGGTPGASPCCPPFSPDSPEPPPNEDDPPPPDGEEKFIGLIVKVETVSARRTATELDGGGGISLFIPRAAVISIAIDIGGRRTWTADVNIRKRNQYVPVPSPGVGYAWAIYNEPGFTTTVTPVLVEVPASEQ